MAKSLPVRQVSNAPILGGPAPAQQPPVFTAQGTPQATPEPPQQQQQQQQQPLTQSAFSGSQRFDSFGTQYDDYTAPVQPGRLQPSASLGLARSIPEGAPVIFEGESSAVTIFARAPAEFVHRAMAMS